MSNRERFLAAEKKFSAGWSLYPRMAHECFPTEALARGRSLLDDATRATRSDARAAARVEFLGKGLTHAELCVAVSRARASRDFLAILDSVTALRAYRRQIENDNVVNLSFCAWIESSAFEQKGSHEIAYSGQPLRSLSDNVAAADLKPVSLRGNFGLLAALGSKEKFHATITIRQVGASHVDAARWRLYSANQQRLAQGDIRPGKSKEVAVTMPAAGIANLVLSTVGNAGQVVLHNDHAVIMGRELALVGESGPLYFFVPPNTQMFTITLKSSSPGETAMLTVFDPNGRSVASGHTSTTAKVDLQIEVSPGDEGKAWSVAPSKAPQGILEDYTIALSENLPPYWSLAPDRLLVPTK